MATRAHSIQELEELLAAAREQQRAAEGKPEGAAATTEFEPEPGRPGEYVPDCPPPLPGRHDISTSTDFASEEEPPRSPQGNAQLEEGFYEARVIDARWAPYRNGMRLVLSVRLANGRPITTFTHFPSHSGLLDAVQARWQRICSSSGVDAEQAFNDPRLLIDRQVCVQLHTQEYQGRVYSEVKSFHPPGLVPGDPHDVRVPEILTTFFRKF